MNRFGLLAAALVLSACSNRTVTINVTVLTKACPGSQAPAPTDGVDHYVATVTGSDIDPVTTTFAASAPPKIPNIPPGSARTLSLTGYAGDPASGGAVKAVGQSLPFDVPSEGGQSVDVTVLLRAAGYFAGVPTIADQGTCAKLVSARAGHTATLLNDGRVLFAGGFQVNADAGSTIAVAGKHAAWNYLDSAEIFDPKTNTSTAVSPINGTLTSLDGKSTSTYDSPEAFQTASLLADGKVLLAGGEKGHGTIINSRPTFMVYDPAADSWSGAYINPPEKVFPGGLAISHHTAVSDVQHTPLIFGGLDYDTTTYEPHIITGEPALWFDENAFNNGQPAFHAVKEQDGSGYFGNAERIGAAAVPVFGGAALIGVGGDALDAGLQDPVLLVFQSNAGVIQHLTGKDESSSGGNDAGVVVLPVRTHMAATIVGTDNRFLIIAGGLSGDGSLINTVSVADSEGGTPDVAHGVFGNSVINEIQPRSDACAVTLQDGRALVLGGESTPGLATTATAELYSIADGGKASEKSAANKLTDSRVMHSCTVLQDGSVLVAGGVKEENGKFTVLDSLELYTPLPQ